MVATYSKQHHDMPGLDTVYEWRVELDCGCVSKGREAQCIWVMSSPGGRIRKFAIMPVSSCGSMWQWKTDLPTCSL
jgi:hypothetical protein